MAGGAYLTSVAASNGYSNFHMMMTGEYRPSLINQMVQNGGFTPEQAAIADTFANLGAGPVSLYGGLRVAGRQLPGTISRGEIQPQGPFRVNDDGISGFGELREPAVTLQRNENILIDAGQGLQSRLNGTFEGVVLGEPGDFASKYLYTIDDRGINIALESTPMTTPRGHIVHTNLSSKAYMGGEAWFGPNKTVTINAGSGRFGDNAGITRSQWQATIEAWRMLGYDVNPIPYGSRR